METTTNTYQKQPEKKPSTALVVLVILLSIAVIVLGYKYFYEKSINSDKQLKKRQYLKMSKATLKSNCVI